LLALAATAFLLADYVQPSAGLCSFQFDCGAVIFSNYGSLLGIPLPVIGLVGLGTIFGLSLFPTHAVGRWLRLLALLAGLAGGALIYLQVNILNQICPYCLTVDACAVLLAAVALAGWLYRPWLALFDQTSRWFWVPLPIIAVALPITFSVIDFRPVPPQVTDHWVPGKVTVIEITDFACPYCREMHANLIQFLQQQGDRVHFVRLTVPMGRHRYARFAARAFLCAQDQGKGDAMAEELFTAEDVGPKSCEGFAAKLGLLLPEYRRCVDSQAVEKVLDAEHQWVQASAPHGLPVVWMQDQMLTGVQTPQTLERAWQAAEIRLRRQERQ
jgi:uncharacterized membrane protein/protein-disulfide isomerase